MENNLLLRSKGIIKLLLFADIILLIVSFFHSTKSFLITSLIVNVVLLGSHQIIQKFSPVFEMMLGTQKVSRGLNTALEKLSTK